MTEAEFQEPARYADTVIFPASLDPDAVNIVRRLNEAGLESYLVGGCVRDLLLGLIPKDFDISTEARPRQIRRLFRNSRIIGRRFKLAHIQFGSKIIEVATFRRTPEGGGEGGDAGSGNGSGTADLLITRDNEFGNAREDVLRRDFTINALLYDVRSAEVIDYVGGVHDLSARTLRTIGDPAIRFAEDPVRMLRAIKFCARLGLVLDPQVEAAMQTSADLIRKSAPPRVIEEIFKLLTCGAAGRALPLLLQFGLLERLLPELGACWRERPEQLAAAGSALDVIDRGRRRVSNAFLLAALVLRPWLERVRAEPQTDPLLWTHDLLDAAAQRTSVPRRDTASAKYLLLAVLRFERPRRGRRSRSADLLSRGTAETMDLLYLGSLSGAVDPELHAHWAQAVAEARAAQAAGRIHEAATGAEADGAMSAPAAGHGDGPFPDGEASAPATEDGRRRRRRGGRGRRRGRDNREGAAASAGRGDAGDYPPPDATASSDVAPNERESRAGPGLPRRADAGSQERATEDTGIPHTGDAAPAEPRRRRRGRRGGRRRRGGSGHPADPQHPDEQTAHALPDDRLASPAEHDERPEAPSAEPRDTSAEPRVSTGSDAGPLRGGRAPQAQPGASDDRRGGKSRRRGGQRRSRGQQPKQDRGSGPRAAPQPAGKGRDKRGPSREPDGGSATQGPGQRHPEDVEDFFDW